jgi:anaerobic ribonucleoside-triphosphate reductase activating protein
MRVQLHAIEPVSVANGPGRRFTIWFQGCTLGCPGCFNPSTHPPAGGFALETAELAGRVLNNPGGIDGLTISGGEPFQQPEALLDLVSRVHPSGLTVLVFTGYTLREIHRQPLGNAILAHVDVLVAGRYVESLHWGRSLLGSRNQQIHLLTGRHTTDDFACLPGREVIVHTDGTVTLTGIAPFAFESRRSKD